MEEIETTSMSSRGQVVIPRNLRKKLNIKEGEKFIVIGSDETILLKKIKMPSFAELTKPLREAKKKIREDEVVDLVHRFRKKK